MRERTPSQAEIAESAAAMHVHVPWSVIVALIAAVASVAGGYLAGAHSAAPPSHAAELNALDKHVSELSAEVRDMAQTMARNADQAHNDVANVVTELHAYEAAHSH